MKPFHHCRGSEALRVLLSLAASVSLSAAPSESEAKRIDFNRDIRPIFSDKCSACHGPDEKKRLANLRLDTPDGGAFSTRGSYRIIVPGDSSKSRLFQRISADKKAMRMPPPVAGNGLSDKQIELVRLWIDQGAKWEIHWAYTAPAWDQNLMTEWHIRYGIPYEGLTSCGLSLRMRLTLRLRCKAALIQRLALWNGHNPPA